MRIVVLVIFLVFGLFAFAENIYGQGYYKWVDEKGTIHFSDNPASSVGNQEKGPPKENGIEVLRRLEKSKRSKTTVADGNTIIIDYSQGSSGGSSRGSTTIVRSGRS
jgi:hypothetical protein